MHPTTIPPGASVGRDMRVPVGTSEMRQQLVALLPRMRRFALVLTRSSDAADDLVQGAVTRALERQSQWIEGSRLDLWLFQIIKSVWLNGLKSASVRRTESLEGQEDTLSTDGSAAMEARITLDEVRAAFGRLPADQQRALLLVSVEGYSYKEAAAILDLPIGTVISRLARGRAALADRKRVGRRGLAKLGGRS